MLQSMSAAIIEDYSYYLMMKFDYKFRTMLMIVPNLLSVVLSILAIYLFLILAIPYGYKRVPGDKQTLHVDEEAASVVRRIIDMAASGASLAQIGQTLSDEKVLIPSAYEERYHPESARHHSYHDPYRWNTTTLTYMKSRFQLRQYIMWRKTMCTVSRMHGICSAAIGQVERFTMF